MDDRLIEFHGDLAIDAPPPLLAKSALPDWIKQIAVDAPNPGRPGARIPTVKQCPPFLEAMACGYVIPLPTDVTLTRHADGRVAYTAAWKAVDTQHPLQYAGSPFEASPIVKFINPWTVRTAPGYSTLFLHPLNQFGLPVQVLSGLVETDTYYRPVHFPSVCTMSPGTTVTLPRGTPIAQVIPIRREDWRSSVGAPDRAARQRIEQEMSADRHNFYKARHWKKKGYA
jgi:antitoxin (DNA-binding transcriptional repressor) of toxin-antitoxin stability system